MAGAAHPCVILQVFALSRSVAGGAGCSELLRPEMGDYVLVTTAELDVKPGAPAGAINGGFFPKRPWPAQYPSVVIGVDDIKSAMRQGKRAPRYSVSQCKFPASAATFHSSIPRGTASACCSPIVREPHEHGRLSSLPAGSGVKSFRCPVWVIKGTVYATEAMPIADQRGVCAA